MNSDGLEASTAAGDAVHGTAAEAVHQRHAEITQQRRQRLTPRIERFQPSRRMDERKGFSPATLFLALQQRIAVERVGRDKEQQVLSVEELHVLVTPDARPEAVDHDVPVRVEQRRPVIRPLFVDVVSATLARYGRREHHDGSEARQIANEASGLSGRKMFGHFEAHRQVEPSRQLQWSREIVDRKQAGGNPQELSVDVRAVHTKDIRDASLTQDLQPRRHAASDINDAPRREVVDDERHDTPGRTRGALPRGAVETFRIHVHGMNPACFSRN